MIEKIQAIVLGTVKHSDRNNVVTLYTRTRGRMAVLSSAAGGKSGCLRHARLQPLSIIEADLNVTSGRDLVPLRQFNLLTVWRELYFHPVRSALALFTTEFLGKLLRESPPDAAMWEFVARSVSLLDTAAVDRLANFHLALLISLLSFTGIKPDTGSWREGRWFDMREGVFRDFPPSHADRLEPDDASTAVRLLRMNFFNASRYRFARDGRRRVLDSLLRYYSIHFPGVSNLKSPDVLAEIFG